MIMLPNQKNCTKPSLSLRHTSREHQIGRAHLIPGSVNSILLHPHAHPHSTMSSSRVNFYHPVQYHSGLTYGSLCYGFDHRKKQALVIPMLPVPIVVLNVIPHHPKPIGSFYRPLSKLKPHITPTFRVINNLKNVPDCKESYKSALTSRNSLLPKSSLVNDVKIEGCCTKDPFMSSMTHVWSWNLEDELKKIAFLVTQQNFNYIGIDTEFPGFIYANPDPKYNGRHGRILYENVKDNVDCMNVIQIGMTLFDEKGNLCSLENNTWQFNFKFDLKLDKHSNDSIKFLKDHGIDLDLHKNHGISTSEFAKCLVSSGLIGNARVKFVTFQGVYDAGYLLKLFLGKELPLSEAEFFRTLKVYVPNLCDLKHLVLRFQGDFTGGLDNLAQFLNVGRIGKKHNGGSDAFVTGNCFFVLKKLLAQNGSPVTSFDFNGKLWGLKTCYSDGSSDNK